MKATPLAVLPALLLCACSEIQPMQQTLEISHLQKGTMSADTIGNWHVSKSGPTLAYKTDSQCSNAHKACMIWGFEFDYSTSDAPVLLDCHDSTTMAASEKRLEESGVRMIEHPFSVELPSSTGHALYQATVIPGAGASRITVSCAYKGIERLNFALLVTGGN